MGSAAFEHVILVDGTDGSILWTLGGKGNDFEDPSGGSATSFFMNHQAIFWRDDNHITLFDNAIERVNAVGCTVNCSRGLHLRTDYEAMTVEVVREYFHPLGLKVRAQGGFTSLEGGNALIAWGMQPGVTEHRGGEVVMDIQLGRIINDGFGENAVYRAFKMDWEGKPSWDPSIAVEDGTVYVSWNGATELTGWVVVSFAFARSLSLFSEPGRTNGRASLGATGPTKSMDGARSLRNRPGGASKLPFR